jgi:large subunit ribosomal protein L10
VYLRVLKNTLARRAIAGTPFEGLTDKLVGPLIYGMSSDPVSCAKVLADFAKSNDKLALKGGAMANSVLDTDAVKVLASMPSRDVLLAQLMGTMQAPVAKFVQTLNEVPARFVRTVAALRDEREKADAPASV